MTGSQTLVGNCNNEPSAAVIKNDTNLNVTASYAITYKSDTLKVTPNTRQHSASSPSPGSCPRSQFLQKPFIRSDTPRHAWW